MIIDGNLAQLGKRPARFDTRTLKLRNYLKIVPAPPKEVSWVTKVPTWPMYLNDKLGDCVIAAAGHMIEQWNFYAGHPFQPTNQQVLTAYEAVGGYSPGNPSTDNGANMLTMLNYWKATGVGGRKILAYMSVNLGDPDEIKTAIQLMGSVYLGIQLPVNVQGRNDWTVGNGGTYSRDGQPGSWGGHCVPICAASPETLTCITWGAPLKMSWNFLADYADEAYAVLSQDWIEANDLSPSGLDVAALQEDLDNL